MINFYTSHLPTYFLVNEIMITMILPQSPTFQTWRQDKPSVVSSIAYTIDRIIGGKSPFSNSLSFFVWVDGWVVLVIFPLFYISLTQLLSPPQNNVARPFKSKYVPLCFLAQQLRVTFSWPRQQSKDCI